MMKQSTFWYKAMYRYARDKDK